MSRSRLAWLDHATQVHLDLPEEDEPIVQSPDGLSSTDDESARRLQVTHESRAGAVTNGPSAKARELQRAPTVVCRCFLRDSD